MLDASCSERSPYRHHNACDCMSILPTPMLIHYVPDMPIVPNAQKAHRSGWLFWFIAKKFIQNQPGILNNATRSPKIIVSHIDTQWGINGLIRRSKVAGNRPL